MKNIVYKKYLFLVLILLGILGLAKSSLAATYYVDQTVGSESNAGTAVAPWKYIPGTSGSIHDPNPGDTVYCDRDSVWILTTWITDIQLTFWGPLPGVNYNGKDWEYDGGVSGTRAKVLLDNSEGGWGFVTFGKDHPTYSTIVDGFDLNGGGNSISGVSFTPVANPQEVLTDGWKILRNSLVHNFGNIGWIYAVRVYAFEEPEGSYWNVRYVEISNNEVYDHQHDGISVYPANGRGHYVRDIIIRGNVVHDIADNCGICIKGKALDVLVERNYVYNSGYHDGLYEAHQMIITSCEPPCETPEQSITVRHNIFNGSGDSNYSTNGIIHLHDAGTGVEPRTLYFYGNILYNARPGNPGFNGGTVIGSNSLYIYNNTLYNADIEIENSNYSALVVKNNISYGGSNSGITVSDPIAIVSNNLTANPSYKNTSNLPTGFIGTYPNTVPNADGLSLNAGSAGIDAGIDLGSLYNKAINGIRSGLWDIGAYEYSGVPLPPDTTPPTTPTNLSATAISSSQINLSWTASTDNIGVTGYRIYRNSTQVGTAATNSYSDSGLSPNTTYTYTVSAYDSAGNNSNQSISASATTQAPSSIITIGETNILSIDDSGNGNLLLAQSATLSQTATLHSLSFYVTTAAGKLRLGIYDSTGPSGGPGQKKAETSEITPTTGWNTANVISQVSLSPGIYWLAYLPQSSSLAFRNESTGTIKLYSYTYGPMPAVFSTSPTTQTYHFSFYATLNSGAGDTTPPANPTGVTVL